MITWKQGYYGWWNAYDEKGTKLVVPSVSKVVDSKDDPELDNWIEEVGEEAAKRIMKLAADRGTVLHTYMENYFLAWAKKGQPRKGYALHTKEDNRPNQKGRHSNKANRNR